MIGSLQLYIWTEIVTICVTENMVNSSTLLTIIKLLGTDYNGLATVVSTKSDSEVILCLQLLGKMLTRTLHMS